MAAALSEKEQREARACALQVDAAAVIEQAFGGDHFDTCPVSDDADLLNDSCYIDYESILPDISQDDVLDIVHKLIENHPGNLCQH